MYVMKKIISVLEYRIDRFYSLAKGKKSKLPITLNSKTSKELIRGVDFSFERILSFYNITFDTLLLVGANDAAELKSTIYKQFKYICAIEPNIDLNHDLKSNLSNFPRFEIFNFAAGEVPEISNLYLSSNNGQSSSLLKPLSHISRAPQVKFTGVREVPVKRIDSVFDNLSCPKVWVVDVQGFELNALKGAGDLLKSVEIIYCEVNREEVYENCTQFKDLDDYLDNFGLHRVLIRWWGSWGDALYVRKSASYSRKLN